MVQYHSPVGVCVSNAFPLMPLGSEAFPLDSVSQCHSRWCSGLNAIRVGVRGPFPLEFVSQRNSRYYPWFNGIPLGIRGPMAVPLVYVVQCTPC
ncbi:hypothetical protein TNIN_374331 [Trichonephila inaurata madagascariensis]|uniref:Uncharacterized protein n=1 Tax=Trichonephila inaurata madagascariensis TaxID=2747483 RepID=A0A8X6ITP5_9ARAC|nr:hypothetical protein TNIN_374331 [Trichonephila inaurata madagascariensis]